ncbi:hypothetical protein ACHAWF_007595 [Thalassiosira exigua]
MTMARTRSKEQAKEKEGMAPEIAERRLELEEEGEGPSDGSVAEGTASDSSLGGPSGDPSDSEGEEDDGREAEEEGGESSSGSDGEGEGEDSEEERPPPRTSTTASAAAEREECAFDLAHLLARNTHQVNAAELYGRGSRRATNRIAGDEGGWYDRPPAIAPDATSGAPVPDESFLLSRAADGATQLLAELWGLPAESTDAGPMARLPSGGETRLPRALPPPPPKQLTKWEQFALQRGIAPKSKRSRKVFDEATGEWKHLTGSLSNKANAGPESWPIIEVKKNDDPLADPWEKLREEKKGRVQKNAESRMRNAERAGSLERGTANRSAKDRKRLEKQREISRDRERRGGLVAPAGVPVDVKPDAKRGKPSTKLALQATQVSTASLGKFDRMREGEPERKAAVSARSDRKRKQLLDANGASKKPLRSEAQRSADILQKVMSGSSSKEKERDIRKGRYAKGETAYDYDFDDGLGAGSFKKKKGRGGIGKMRKVTKKHMK